MDKHGTDALMPSVVFDCKLMTCDCCFCRTAVVEQLRSEHAAVKEQEHLQRQEMSQLQGEVTEQASQLRQAQALVESLQEQVLQICSCCEDVLPH